MAAKRSRIEAGSGNVFADLGYADAKERTLKVELAMEVNRLLRARGLTQAAVAKVLGIRQPHVSDLVRYRLERFSVERLMAFIVGLGQDIERVRPRPAAVVPAEIYSDARVREFGEADRSTAAENARVAKALRRRRR